jgi:Tfp pilus assembly protein FimV
MPPAGLGRPPRVSAATYWRRRLAVALGAVIVVLIAGQAGAALGSTPLEAPGRPPSVTRSVVRSGDSLWTVAGRVAPNQDPREVVDALDEARHGAPLLAGETIVWQR